LKYGLSISFYYPLAISFAGSKYLSINAYCIRLPTNFCIFFAQLFCSRVSQLHVNVGGIMIVLFYFVFACMFQHMCFVVVGGVSAAGTLGKKSMQSENIGSGSVAFQISIYRQLFRLFTLIYLRCCLCGFVYLCPSLSPPMYPSFSIHFL